MRLQSITLNIIVNVSFNKLGESKETHLVFQSL